MIYIIVFLLSFILCSVGEKRERLGKIASARFFILAAVMLVSVLAGIRDYTIGVDIETYGHWMFLGAQNADSIFKYTLSFVDIEVGYSTFVYVIAQLFESEHWLYFFTGLFIYSFIMLGIRRFRNYISQSWAWCAYLFLLYGDTLNAMRQCMAVAVALWAFSFALDKEYKKFILATIFSMLFHVTAVFSFGIFLVYWILSKKDTIITKTTIVAGTIAVLLLYNRLLSFMMSIGLLNIKFERYIADGIVFTSLNPILVRLPFVLVVILFSQLFRRGKGAELYDRRVAKVLAEFLVMACFIEMFVAEMRLVNATLYRMAFYFTTFRCVAIGRVVNVLHSSNRRIIKCTFLILLIAIWWYQNVMMGNNDIYPFTSEVIGLI